jgi:hypothetical protein
MTQLLEKTFDKASNLPEEDQDAVAALILKEIESEWRAAPKRYMSLQGRSHFYP